jgi:hypothetical protein
MLETSDIIYSKDGNYEKNVFATEVLSSTKGELENL